MPFSPFKTENASESPFPIEGAAVVLAHFPEYQNSSFKLYVQGGFGRFSGTANPRALYELNIPNVGIAEFKPPTWRYIDCKAIDETLDSLHIPTARWYHSLTLVPQKQAMLLFGGEFGYLKQNDSKLYQLDLKKGDFVWSQLTTASETIHSKSKLPLKPLARCQHSACASSSGHPYLYIYGGYNTLLDQELGDLWRFDVDKQTWRLLCGGPQPPKQLSAADDVTSAPVVHRAIPKARFGHLMTISPKNDALYVLGGNSKDAPFKEIWRFNLDKLTWEQLAYDCTVDLEPVLPELTESSDNSASVQLVPEPPKDTPQRKNSTGSLLSKSSKPYNELPFFIPARNGAAVMFGHSILLTGGETLMSEVPSVLDDLLIYNTQTQKFIKTGLSSPDIALVSHKMVLYNDQLLVVGGRKGWPFYNDVMSLSILKESKVSKYLLSPDYNIVGIPLDELMKRPENKNLPFPYVYSMLIDYLVQKGADEEGIFRISPSTGELNGLRLRFEQGVPAADIDLSRYSNVHSVSGLLKLLLREIPGSLLTHGLFDAFLAIYDKDPTKNPDVAIKEIKTLVDKLPPYHGPLLKAVLNMAFKICENSHMSKMNSEAMARSMTFSLVSMPTREKELEVVKNTTDNPLIKLVKTMVEQHTKL